MPITKEITLYEFSELPEKVQNKIIDRERYFQVDENLRLKEPKNLCYRFSSWLENELRDLLKIKVSVIEV